MRFTLGFFLLSSTCFAGHAIHSLAPRTRLLVQTRADADVEQIFAASRRRFDDAAPTDRSTADWGAVLFETCTTLDRVTRAYRAEPPHLSIPMSVDDGVGGERSGIAIFDVRALAGLGLLNVGGRAATYEQLLDILRRVSTDPDRTAVVSALQRMTSLQHQSRRGAAPVAFFGTGAEAHTARKSLANRQLPSLKDGSFHNRAFEFRFATTGPKALLGHQLRMETQLREGGGAISTTETIYCSQR